MPPGERDGEARGVVCSSDLGVAVLALEKGRDEAHGRAGGEEEDYAVALLPGSPQRHFWLCFVKAGVGPGAFEAGCVLAAAGGRGDEPDHRFLPETTKTGVSAARRGLPPIPFPREVCISVRSEAHTSQPQSRPYLACR